MMTKNVQLMGTIIRLQILSSQGNAAKELDGAVDKLKYFESVFSANDDSSRLMQVNQAAGKRAVTVPRELFWLIEVGKRYSLFAKSNLNIAIGPLVKLWHIGFNDAHEPSDQEIQAKLPLTNPRDIHLDVRTSRVYLAKEGMEIDLGALVKGYVADQIVNYWIHDGVYAGLVNLGGNVVVIGDNPSHEDRQWVVGLQDPAQPQGHCIRNLKLRNASIVTSGTYQRHLQVNHRFFHHLINPLTGYPFETNLASLSIISHKSLPGELWTSILFGHSWDYISQAVQKTAGISAIGIWRNGTMKDLFN